MNKKNLKDEFISLKKNVFEILYEKMNAMQQKAVFNVNGPLLILAGAGSGKTTVLVNRIAYLLKYGNAYYEDENSITDEDITFLRECVNSKNIDEDKFQSLVLKNTVNPYNVLAITFTNKAANELKERLLRVLGPQASSIYSGTFHSICVRILRKEIHNLGYDKSFTIYNTDDSVRVVKDCLSELEIDEKMFNSKQVLNNISQLKDKNTSPEELLATTENDYRLNTVAKIFNLYQIRLKKANALDFDDIICKTVDIFKQFPDVLSHYQNLFKYVLVDEYQDTNTIQYELVSLISNRHKNICVVGDDDQSIYRFRGATIENILNFEKQFDNCIVIRLEQNYRSTQTILNAANNIIQNNTERKGKNLWTDNGDGEKIVMFRGTDEHSEASFITNTIQTNISNGSKYNSNAILYRVNAQSLNIEKHLINCGIPYRIIGGTKFFERKEIRDIVAYLAVINNPRDTVRMKRIINEPKRGIGDATIKKAEQISLTSDISMYEVMSNAKDYEGIHKKATSFASFVKIIDTLQDKAVTVPLSELYDNILELTGYEEYLRNSGEEGKTRLENIHELKSNIINYETENPDGDLAGFLEEISLYTDLDELNNEADYVVLMTLHSAKGLEFDTVFIIGMEDGIFPGKQNLSSLSDMEEERRLAYVGVTRAKQQLYLTNSAQRLIFGMMTRNQISRFISEIPKEYLDIQDKTIRKTPVVAPQKHTPIIRDEVEGVGVDKKSSVVVDFCIGDKVLHKIFGEGMVLNITPMGNDNLVEICFDKVGTKKIMANYAKVSKIS